MANVFMIYNLCDENVIHLYGSDYCFEGKFTVEVDVAREYVVSIEPIQFAIYTCDGDLVFDSEIDMGDDIQLGFYGDVLRHWLFTNKSDAFVDDVLSSLNRFVMNPRNYYER